MCHSWKHSKYQPHQHLPRIWALPAAAWFHSASAGPGVGRPLWSLLGPKPPSLPAPRLLPCRRSQGGAEQLALHREAVPAGFRKARASSGVDKGFSAFMQARWGVDLINTEFIWMSSPMMLSVLPSCIPLPCLSRSVGTEELSAWSRAAVWRETEAGAEMQRCW